MQGADYIWRHGFQTSQSGLLGAGVYLTTEKSKAALYGPRVLTCSVEVGLKCCIDTRKHPDRLIWPVSCDTKWIPAEAVHQWTCQKGDVHCVWDKNRIDIICVEDVRCCPCSIPDCRQCFPDPKQQKAQRHQLSKHQLIMQQNEVNTSGKGKDELSMACPAASPSQTCISQAPRKQKARRQPNKSGKGKDQLNIACSATLPSQTCVSQAPPQVDSISTLSQMETLMAEIKASSQIAVKVDSCSNGLAQEDIKGQVDGSSTASGSGTSDDDECPVIGWVLRTLSRSSA